MQLRYDQLQSQLSKTLAPVYLLTGNEPFLLDEGRQAILTAAKKHGFSERLLWQVETGFSWQQLLFEADSFSLFSNKQLIEIRCTNNQINEAAAKILLTYVNQPPTDKVLLIGVDKLTPAQQKAAWYQAILKIGIIVPLWPLEGDSLLQWLKQRLHSAKLKIDGQGLQLLAERAEGNLLAISQEIEKLSLLYPQGNLTADIIADTVNDSARFDVFTLSDAILQGNTKRVSRVLFCLKDEGVDPILILWAVTKEIRTLATMAAELTKGNNIEKLLQEYRVWEKRKPLIRQALQRHNAAKWRQLLQFAGKIDLLIKGQASGNAWDALLQLCLTISDNKLPFALL